MRTHLRLQLPRLQTLTVQQPLAFTIVDRRRQLQQEGHMPLSQLLRQFSHLPFVCWLAEGDAITTQLTLPPLKKSQRETAIRSRLQSMLLQPYDCYVVSWEESSSGNYQVSWALKKTLQPLLQPLQQAAISRIQLIPSTEENHANWRTEPLPKTNLFFVLDSQATSSAMWPWLKWPLLATVVWWSSLALGQYKVKHYTHALQQSNIELVQSTFPHLPLVINPLAQAKQALQQQEEAHSHQPNSASLIWLLERISELAPELNDNVRALQYENQRLQLTLTEPLTSLFTTPSWQQLQDQAAAQQIVVLDDETNPVALWIEVHMEQNHE